MKKVISFFGCIFPFAVFIGIQGYVATMVGKCIEWMMKYFNVSFGGNVSTAQLMGPINTYTLFVCTLTTSIVGAIWYHYGYAARYEVSFRKATRVRDYGYIIGIAFAFIFVTNIIMALVVTIAPSSLSEYNELFETAGSGSEVVMFITAAFIAPIGEECFYRGVVLRKAEKIMPFVWANLLQAALFGIMHGNLLQGSYAFVIGLLIGYLNHKYQSIFIPILFHVAYNIMGQTVPMLAVRLGNIAYFLITVASIFVLIALLKKVSKVKVTPKAEEMISVS